MARELGLALAAGQRRYLQERPTGNLAAYDLYLRSAAISRDPAPNKEAITLLERSVALDPSYAPAWSALGDRHYYDGTYSDGGQRALERSQADSERALSLDPQLVDASERLILLRAEGGDLNTAWDEVTELLRRRPDSAEAHFTLGYVLRYAGLLEESARECDAALRLDPRNYGWRSCAQTFTQLGQYSRAKEYLALDAGSQWAKRQTIVFLVRQGKWGEAREAARITAPFSPTIAACLEGLSDSEIGERAREEVAGMTQVRDSEPKFMVATGLAGCRQTRLALQLLRKAVEQNYCAWPVMDNEPLFASIRGTPEFAEIRKMGIDCQKRFLAHRNAAKPR